MGRLTTSEFVARLKESWRGNKLQAAMLALLLPSLCPANAAAPDGQAWRQWTTREGLPHNSVLALWQDQSGGIIAGTEQGAAYYDGRSWQALSLPAPLANAAIGALAEDGDGRLWLGSDRAGGWRQDGAGGYERIDLPDTAAVVHVLTWTGQSMLVGSNEGLHECSARCVAFVPAIGKGVRALLLEREDGVERLWVGTHGDGLRTYTRTPGTPWRAALPNLRRADGLPNNFVIALTRIPSGGPLWIGTGRGVARWDGQQLRSFSAKEGLPGAMSFGIAPGYTADGASLVIAALRPGGLLEFDADDRWRIRDTRAGLPANAVHTLLRERYRDALWLGTLGAGVLRAEPGRWAVLDERSGLPDRAASGIGHVAGRLWIGTAGGAVEWRDGAFVPLLPELGRILVQDLIDSAAGERWVATPAGVHRYRADGRHRHYTVDNSALPGVGAERLVASAAEGSDAVYIGTRHGLARWTAGGEELQVVRGEAGWLLDSAIFDLAARNETLAIASSRGAAVVRGGRWRRLPEACLGGDVASAVAIAPAGWIVFALRGGALLRVDSEQCVAMADVSAIGAPSRLVIHGDSLTVFGARGAERFALVGDRIDGPPLRLGPADGLEQTEVIAATADSLGRLYAATSAGVYVYDPRPLAHPRSFSTAPLRITAASYGEPAQPLAPGMRLPAGTEVVAFAYRLYSFEREHAHRYRVQLLGLDAALRAWTDAASIRFERLPPGSYRLLVEARDADGAAVEPVAFAFAVRAWWWQQPWVQLLAALALIGSGILIGRWRIRQAMRRAEALEEQVQRRTRDLAQANAKLAALAVTDTLTGLPNRRHYSEIAPALAAREEVLVGLIDIDHFKRINDTLGHEAGDTVLVAVARALTAALGPGEQALRWGGEEFLVLLPGIDEKGTEPRIRALLEAIASVRVPVPADADANQITASAGFERYERAAGDGTLAALERAIARADAALYAAKRSGRDRAVCHGPPSITIERAGNVR